MTGATRLVPTPTPAAMRPDGGRASARPPEGRGGGIRVNVDLQPAAMLG